MGYFSNLHIEMQEENDHLQSQEPDFMEYAKEQMKTDQYAKEFDKAFGNPKQQIDDFIESIKGE